MKKTDLIFPSLGVPGREGTLNPSEISTQGNSSGAGCISNTGVFGTLDGIPTQVEFPYELEVRDFCDTISADVLPTLEQAMTKSIISEVFTDECDTSKRRKLRFQRRLEIVGISKNPMDVVLKNGMYIF